jgi:hypothetical protein
MCDTQTDKGYEIPVPKRKDVFDVLDRAAIKREKPSRIASPSPPDSWTRGRHPLTSKSPRLITLMHRS